MTRVALIALLTVAYFALPGHPALPAHGIPLGPIGTTIVAAVVVLGVMFGQARLPRRVVLSAGALILVLAGVRVVIARAATQVGWVARYYANLQWAGPPQWSSDFRRVDATRIDSRIQFKDDTFPAHYLNDVTFPSGIRREVTEPMSVDWSGFSTMPSPTAVKMSLRARGTASVRVDDRTVLSISSPRDPVATNIQIPLAPGSHALSVRYAKPRDTDGLVEFSAADGLSGSALLVTPTDRRPADARLLVLARAMDIAVLVTFAGVTLYGARSLWASRDGMSWLVPATLFAIFGAQGWHQAIPFAGRVVALTGGDDWWGFEACARDILRHGPLMTLGKPVGQADPYFYHPLYCYFLAVVHGVTGESLFGPIFVQFLILAVVGVIVWRFASELFGQLPALIGLIVLVMIFELDFARYYTVTLLSENIYILTVTLAIVPFVRWVRLFHRSDLVQMSVWGGISTITRPSMLFYLFPALALVALVAFERGRGASAAVRAVLVAAATWLATMAPVTARNLWVSHRFVLVSDVPSASVLTYNIPASLSAAEYGARWRGTFGSALKVIAEMAWEHPLAMLGVFVKKLGFSLGMTQWMAGYRPHPELVAVTALYLGMCIVSKRMRDRVLWPVHLFVVMHLASMMLTLPWNYGYRLIIPPFVYTITLSVAALSSLVQARRFERPQPAPSGA